MSDARTAVAYRNLESLSAFYSLSSTDRERLAATVSPNDEADVKHAVRGYVLPRLQRIESREPGSVERIKASLKYFLNTRAFPADELFYEGEPPFDHPDDPIDYYRWVWDVLAPDEPYAEADLSQYVVTDETPRP
ncbi:MAG: hypothetical protein JWN40_6055 [Phycisphaerales bacterium]|nr:hypothetical protein [Phycisphaerales bacterium]